MRVGNQPRDQVDQEIDGAAMVGVINPTHVVELIVDSPDDGSLAQEKFVRQRG